MIPVEAVVQELPPGNAEAQQRSDNDRRIRQRHCSVFLLSSEAAFARTLESTAKTVLLMAADRSMWRQCSGAAECCRRCCAYAAQELQARTPSCWHQPLQATVAMSSLSVAAHTSTLLMRSISFALTLGCLTPRSTVREAADESVEGTTQSARVSTTGRQTDGRIHGSRNVQHAS